MHDLVFIGVPTHLVNRNRISSKRIFKGSEIVLASSYPYHWTKKSHQCVSGIIVHSRKCWTKCPPLAYAAFFTDSGETGQIYPEKLRARGLPLDDVKRCEKFFYVDSPAIDRGCHRLRTFQGGGNKRLVAPSGIQQ